jgi:hypothetical protein
MKLVQRIALFIIYLIISLPFVFAQELNVQKFQGKNNAKGFAKVEDQLTIEVLVKIPGEEIISKEQVRLYVEDSYAFFDTCVQEGTAGFYKCTFFEPEFEAYEPIEFTIELRDDDDNIVGSEKRKLIIDNIAPVIKELTVEPPVSTGDITISYVAEDYGLTHGDTNECSGIKTITVNAGTQAITDTGEPGLCAKDNILEMSITQAGTKQICVAATDHLNFASPPKCTEVKIDKAPPTIEKVSILDEQGFVLTHVKTGEERIAKVNAVITDDGEVDQSTVYGTFSQLNPNMPEAILPDMIESNIYSWQGIPVSEVSSCKITISAKDTLGNEKTGDFDCTIKADDTPPTATGIVTGTGETTAQAIEEGAPAPTREGTPLYGYGTQLLIEFEDKDNAGGPGIGMQAHKAYLDLSELGMDDFTEADFCARISGPTWRCSWLINPPATTNEGAYTITLSEGTADDLDNMLGTAQNYEIIYDNTGPKKPEIIGYKVISGELGIEYTGGAVRGDYLQYTVRSGEFDKAFANFEELGGDKSTTPTTCEDVNENTQDCIFEALIDLSGPFTAQLSFNFFDDANNKASTNTTFEVYGIDNETAPKYWKSPPAVTCSPQIIYRDTAKIIPATAACRVDLTTPRKDISTLAITGPESPDMCNGDVELTLNDIYMINNVEGSTHPYLFMKLEPREYYTAELKINCPIQIFSKRAVKGPDGRTHYYVSMYPQQLPANMSIGIGDSPLGSLNANVDDEIESAFKEGLADVEWISELRKWIYYAELICWAKNIITNIIGALYLVTVVLKVVASVLWDSAYGSVAAPPVESAATGVCNVEEKVSKLYGDEVGGIVKFLDAICSVVNCASGGKGGLEGILGGGATGLPWCTGNIGLGGTEFGKLVEESGISIWPPVKDSLIVSLMCLCLPGIIYNLEKKRQIDCFKSVCLYDLVKQNGYPIDFCEEMHGYMTCMFWMGEIFALLPFVYFFDQLINMVVTWISDPVALFTQAIGAVCETACPTQNDPWGFTFCALYKTTAVVMESIAAVKQVTDKENEFGKPPGTQYCDRMEEIKDEMSV